MYVILVNDDNTLSAPKKERIMQRSKLVDTLWFLSNPIYKEYDMTDCTVLLEYVLPVSKKYCNETLRLSDDRYEEYLKYLLPLDTNLTSEAGEIELQLTFILADLDCNGKPIQRVRKVSSITIDIVPISAWSDIIPDDALTAIDQRIIKTDAQIKALDDISKTLNDNKADNILYKDGVLRLLANKNVIGDPININSCNCDEDGIPVVDFNNSTDSEIPDYENNVVEF